MLNCNQNEFWVHQNNKQNNIPYPAVVSLKTLNIINTT
jgi:hypothetical protein